MTILKYLRTLMVRGKVVKHPAREDENCASRTPEPPPRGVRDEIATPTRHPLTPPLSARPQASRAWRRWHVASRTAPRTFACSRAGAASSAHASHASSGRRTPPDASHMLPWTRHWCCVPCSTALQAIGSTCPICRTEVLLWGVHDAVPPCAARAAEAGSTSSACKASSPVADAASP